MSNKLKGILLVGAVLVTLGVIIVIVVHRSRSHSSHRCENEGELYYQDPITGEAHCFRPASKGLCGNLMVFKEDKRKGVATEGKGVCQCDLDQFERTMIHHPDTNQCYFIFTQAFCEDGQWLSIDKRQGPVCETRACADLDQVPLRNGRCVKLGAYDKLACGNGGSRDDDDDFVRFHRKKIYPSCGPLELPIGIVSVGVPSTDCPVGYFSTGIGDCQPAFDFD